MTRSPAARPLAALSLVLALGACQMDAPPPASPAPPPAVIQPVPQSRQVELVNRSTTTRSVDADGTVRTETRSSNVSVDTGALATALFGGATGANAATPAAAQRSNYFGAWTLRQPDGANCTLTLRDGQPRGFVMKGGCFHDSVFFASGWLLRGTELVLTDAVGKELAVLRATGPNRLEGNGLILSR